MDQITPDQFSEWLENNRKRGSTYVSIVPSDGVSLEETFEDMIDRITVRHGTPMGKNPTKTEIWWATANPGYDSLTITRKGLCSTRTLVESVEELCRREFDCRQSMRDNTDDLSQEKAVWLNISPLNWIGWH